LEDGDDENVQDGVAHQPSRLPASEGQGEGEDEDGRRFYEELADAEMLEVLDLDELERTEWADL
jgi:hypothetical protein